MVSANQRQFTLTAKGHVNIQAIHSSTFEVTKESYLSLRGDCIIGVDASHDARDINTKLGSVLRSPDTQIRTILSDGKITEEISGHGSPQLTLFSATSLVWRTSDFVDERTVAIRCNKAAKDLDRRLIESLQNPNTVIQITLIVFSDNSPDS
jgi:hypothetical protein